MKIAEIDLRKFMDGQAIVIELDGKKYCICRENNKLKFFMVEGK